MKILVTQNDKLTDRIANGSNREKDLHSFATQCHQTTTMEENLTIIIGTYRDLLTEEKSASF